MSDVIITDDELEAEVERAFLTRTGFTPAECPADIAAEMMYEIEDSDD